MSGAIKYLNATETGIKMDVLNGTGFLLTLTAEKADKNKRMMRCKIRKPTDK